jgi:hypothetical protein
MRPRTPQRPTHHTRGQRMRMQDARSGVLRTSSVRSAKLLRSGLHSSNRTAKNFWHTFPSRQSRSRRLIHSPEPSKDGSNSQTPEETRAVVSRLESACLVQARLTNLIILGPNDRGPQAAPAPWKWPDSDDETLPASPSASLITVDFRVRVARGVEHRSRLRRVGPRDSARRPARRVNRGHRGVP